MSYTPRPEIIYQELVELQRLVKQLLTQSPLGYSSITEGSLRVASNEGLIVEGSAKVSGWLIVTGTERVVGTLEVLGTLDGSGTLNWTGPWNLAGDGDITGAVDITGLLRLRSDLEVLDGGQIKVGGITLTPVSGGRIQVGGPGGIIIDAATKSITIPGANPITISTDGSLAKIDLGVADIKSNGAQAVMQAGSYLLGVDAGKAAIGNASVQWMVSGGSLYALGVGSAGSASGTPRAIGIDDNGKVVLLSSPV